MTHPGFYSGKCVSLGFRCDFEVLSALVLVLVLVQPMRVLVFLIVNLKKAQKGLKRPKGPEGHSGIIALQDFTIETCVLVIIVLWVIFHFFKQNKHFFPQK